MDWTNSNFIPWSACYPVSLLYCLCWINKLSQNKTRDIKRYAHRVSDKMTAPVFRTCVLCLKHRPHSCLDELFGKEEKRGTCLCEVECPKCKQKNPAHWRCDCSLDPRPPPVCPDCSLVNNHGYCHACKKQYGPNVELERNLLCIQDFLVVLSNLKEGNIQKAVDTVESAVIKLRNQAGCSECKIIHHN